MRPRVAGAAIAVCVALLVAPSPGAVSFGQGPEDHLAAAREYMVNLRLDKASREIQKALDADPRNFDAWRLRGDLALRRADLDGALDSWTRASSIVPDNVELLISIGDLLTRRNERLEEALSFYNRPMALDPQSARTLVSIGSIHERREQWPEAAAAYRKALGLDPNFVRARSSLGAVLFKLDKYEEASLELRKAIELSPRDLRSHVFLGLSQNHLGRYDNALEELKDALQIDPHAANQLIGVREQQPQFMHLIDIFTKAFEQNSREAGRSYDLAVIYFYAHDYESAWKFLIKAEQMRYPIPIEMKEVVWSRRRLRSP